MIIFVNIIRLGLILILASGCRTELENEYIVDYVNPLIGTAPSTTESSLAHGHGTENNAQVVPFVTVPFGMTNWTPQTSASETKCVAPYYYVDTVINGFRGSHWLSGSCVQDYGSMTIMPVSGTLSCLPELRGSGFSHQDEISTPYYYKVHLSDYDIDAEMTATTRSGLFRFTFLRDGEAHIVVNPNSDEALGFVKFLPETNEIVGYNPVHRIYQGWGDEAGFNGYFVVRFEKDIDSFGTYDGASIFEGETQISNQENIGSYVSFRVSKNESVNAVIGTSFTSISHARENLEAETEKMDFQGAKSKLKEIWEERLTRVQVEGNDHGEKVKFYTAMYHSFLHPRIFNDVDGSYPGFAGVGTIQNSGKSNYYVDFSIWDTYRALHPLLNLLAPKTNADMMNSLLKKAEQGEWLPIFPCWNSYTSAMIGDHVISVLADAYMKGIIEIGDEHYKYLLQNAFKSPGTFEEYNEGKGRRALESYLKFAYVPLEDEVKESFHKKEQVSRTLEYAYDDFALSQVAKEKGDNETYKILRKRALNYNNVYSEEDSCVRGRYADGSFTSNFDKYSKESYITEGTPYQYTWYVPHDIYGLIEKMGGEEGFNANLDHFHTAGQYWHGNEPGHQIPFLYNFSGQAWKTQFLVSEIMKTEYGSDVGGLSGNDDAGQMSAWYVFAALGFYPVCPSVPEYTISGPHFDKITIQFNNEKKFVILAPGASEGKKYIQGLKWNGKNTDKTYLNHFEISEGGILEFEMGEEANKNWGRVADSRPYSMSLSKD